MAGTVDGDDQPTFAARLEHLIETVHPAGRGPYTLDEIAQGIKAASGVTISVAYLNQLSTGRRDNPSLQHLQGIAAFFGVPVGYFFDPVTKTATDEELALLNAIRDEGIRDLALTALELSPETRAAVSRIMNEMHGLDHRAPGAAPSTSQRTRRGRKRKDDTASS